MKDWVLAFLAAASVIGMTIWSTREIIMLYRGFL